MRAQAEDLADDLWHGYFAQIQWMYFCFLAAYQDDAAYECAPLPAMFDMALREVGMCIGASISFVGEGSDARARLYRPGSSENFPEPDEFEAMAEGIFNDAILAHVVSEEALKREEVERAEAARVEKAREARRKRAQRLAQTRARRERLRVLHTAAARDDRDNRDNRDGRDDRVTPVRFSARLAAKRKRADGDGSSVDQRRSKRGAGSRGR